MKYLNIYNLRFLAVALFLSLFVACAEDPIDPTGDFTYEVKSDNTLSVAFAASGADAVSVEWNFGDGGTSTSLHPVHTYDVGGDYTVVLTILGESGSSSAVITKMVTLIDSPVGGFTYESNYLTVSFTNTTEFGVSYTWDFGDGETSTDENPVHTFAESGDYIVSLTASGAQGSVPSTVSEAVSAAEGVIAVFNGDFTLPGTADIIQNWDSNPEFGDIPGWTSEGDQYDCGVLLYSTDGAVADNGTEYFGKLRHTDGPLYNLTDHVISAGETFRLSLDLCDLYWGAASYRLYYNTGDGIRHILDSKNVEPWIDAGNSSNWVSYELVVVAPEESVGARLGIELETIGTEWGDPNRDGWSGADNVQLFIR
ncbi:PKD domain-containing protein [Sunxiuqinia sp. A32]|uniref:PKD domain-containing protein n=1 Tax=Sunxiuqinia sp. A32 TaxID=3461496 RepID=UPI0040452202